MPPTSTKYNSQKGFTLVEIAVVAPMMILIVVGLMAMLIALVNGISIPTKRNVLVNSGSKVSEAISSDVTNSAGFLASTPAGFSDPNSGDYASPPANTEVLMIQGYNQTQTTDSSDTTGTRTQPAFKGASPCGATTTIDKTNIVPIVAVYFVKNSTLWRRVLTETTPGPTCVAPLLIRQTCPPGGACTDEDTPIAKDSVTEFKLTYYSDSTSDTVVADKTLGQSILISMKGVVSSGNDTTTYTSNLRVSRISD